MPSFAFPCLRIVWSSSRETFPQAASQCWEHRSSNSTSCINVCFICSFGHVPRSPTKTLQAALPIVLSYLTGRLTPTHTFWDDFQFQLLFWGRHCSRGQYQHRKHLNSFSWLEITILGVRNDSITEPCMTCDGFYAGNSRMSRIRNHIQWSAIFQRLLRTFAVLCEVQDTIFKAGGF